MSKIKWKKIKILLNLPKSLPLAWNLIKDSRLPIKNKVIFLGISMLYLIIPLDLIPDFPLLGQIDDFAVFMYLFNWFLNTIPSEILEDYS